MGDEILEDFELEDLHANMSAYSTDDFSIKGHLDSLRFYGTKIINQGTILKNARDAWMFGEDFDDGQAWLNEYLSTDFIRVKSLAGLFFETFALQLQHNSLSVGVDLDPIYN